MDVQYALLIINELEEEWYKPPEEYFHRKKIDFEYQSYKHSAIEEIKRYLLEHKNDSPFESIDDFRHMTDTIACNTGNEKTNFRFSVYCEVATDVLDVLSGIR